jgi:hypothetical protein
LRELDKFDRTWLRRKLGWCKKMTIYEFLPYQSISKINQHLRAILHIKTKNV